MTDISRKAVDAAIDRLSFIPTYNAIVLLSAQADEIDRQRKVIETCAAIDRKSSARIETLEKALRDIKHWNDYGGYEGEIDACIREILENQDARS